MIVVLSQHGGWILRWARQFAAHDPANRAVVVFPRVPNGRRAQRRVRERIEQIYGRAAERAGPGGTVIVWVGHGGFDETAGGLAAGMVDLAPNEALRIHQANVFYERRSDESIVTRADRIGGRRCRELLRRYDFNEDTRRPAPSTDADTDAYASCFGAANSRDRLEIRRAFDRIGRVLRRNQIANVTLLTCRVGGATQFVDKIAEDWGVQVTAYTRRVGYVPDEGGQVRLYLYGDSVGSGTNTERARHELPTVSRYTSGSGD